jgi:hypothetical protein
MNPLTLARIDHGLASLAMDQLRGVAPPPGQVSPEEIARRAGVSKSSVLRLEMIAKAKLAAALISDPELPPHLRRKLAATLSR